MPKKEKNNFVCRNAQRYTIEDLHYALENKNWEEFFNARDPNICRDIMHHNFVSSLDEVAPMIKMKNVKKTETWINAELLRSIRERGDLKRNLEQCNYENDNLLKRFNENRTQVKRTVINCKRTFVAKKVKDSAASPKK